MGPRPVGPGFRVILAFNEGSAYSGTREVNAALRDRLMPIYADYLPELTEAKVLVAQPGAMRIRPCVLVSFAAKVRARGLRSGLTCPQGRLFRMLDLLRYCGESWADAFVHGVLDLVGDPIDRKPQRDAIAQVADLDGLTTWPDVTWAVAQCATPATGGGEA